MKRLGAMIGRLCAVASIGVLSMVSPAGEVAYESDVFDAALAARGGFLVAVVADWCSACSRQKSVVAELLAQPRFEHLTLIVVDFDRDLEFKRRLKIVMQGTFLVFRDGREVARSIGTTDKAAMAALFDQAR